MSTLKGRRFRTLQLRGHSRALLLLGEERALHFGHLRQPRQAGHLQIPRHSAAPESFKSPFAPASARARWRIGIGADGSRRFRGKSCPSAHHQARMQQCVTSLLHPELEFAVLCITTDARCKPLTSSSLIS